MTCAIEDYTLICDCERLSWARSLAICGRTSQTQHVIPIIRDVEFGSVSPGSQDDA